MLVFPENLILEDERVILSPLKESDLEHLLVYAINEPETWIYSLSSPAGRHGMKKYIADALAQQKVKKEYPFIVFDKNTGTFAGCTRFYDIQPDNLTTQLGYTWYGKNFRRTGLNRHCKLLLLSYAFEKWGMERVEFRADARNQASILAMQGIGCKVEGILRSNCVIASGGRRDSIVLSILKAEWFENVKEDLVSKIDT
jgi:N-acetyltransferase